MMLLEHEDVNNILFAVSTIAASTAFLIPVPEQDDVKSDKNTLREHYVVSTVDCQ